VLKCSDSTAPYSCVVTLPRSRGRRSYGLTAKAFDAAGNVGNSPTVTVPAK